MSTTSRQNIDLILDFDGTITHTDTLSILGNIRTSADVLDNLVPPSQTWDQIVSAYLADYSAHAASYSPSTAERRSLEHEAQWLNSLAPIEQRSVKRVEDAGIFVGVTRETVREAVRRAVGSASLKIRPGCAALLGRCVPLLASAASNDGAAPRLSVLSVNWSRVFIREALGAGLLATRGECGVERLDELPIFANEIEGLQCGCAEFSTEGGSSGRFCRKNGNERIVMSRDKLRVMRMTVIPGGETDGDKRRMTVYVGDSCTDLECLVAADVGICMRDEEMGSSQRQLAETLERIGIKVLPLHELQLQAVGGHKKLYWTSDFHSVSSAFGIGGGYDA